MFSAGTWWIGPSLYLDAPAHRRRYGAEPAAQPAEGGAVTIKTIGLDMVKSLSNARRR